MFHNLALHLARIRVAVAPLHSRVLTRLGGVDARKFAQKLITNDIHLLTPTAPLHAAVLSPQGRILHDVFLVLESDSSLLVDHCASSAEPFRALLRRYRMRSNVSIDACPELRVVALVARHALPALPGSYADPRHEALGRRFVLAADALPRLEADLVAAGVSGLTRVDENLYDLYRTCLGVPSDPVEIVSGVSLPSEATLDYLHAIAYDKGCYVGQELTARTHFVGTTRKMLVPIVPVGSGDGSFVAAERGSLFEPWAKDLFGDAFGALVPPVGAELDGGAASVRKRAAGKVMRGGVWGAGFALLRLESLADIDSAVFEWKGGSEEGGDDDGYARRVKPLAPHWWAAHQALQSLKTP